MAQYVFDPRDEVPPTIAMALVNRWSSGVDVAITHDHFGAFKPRCLKLSQSGAGPLTGFYSFTDVDGDSQRADIDAYWCGYMGAGNQDLRLVFRASGSAGSETGYVLRGVWATAKLEFGKYAGSSTFVSIADAAFGFSFAAWYWVRVQMIGSALKAKVWSGAGTEPVAWNLETTDSSITAAGWVGFGLGASSAGFNRYGVLTLATGSSAAIAPVSRAAWQAWLEADGRTRQYLAELHYGNGTPPTDTVLRLGNRSYFDALGGVLYDEAIVEVPVFSARAGEILIGRTTLGVGTMQVDNSDGARDGWLKANFDGRECHLLLGDPTWNRHDFRSVVRATVESVENSGPERLMFNLRDVQAVLNRGIAGVGPSTGSPEPVMAGKVLNAEPVLQSGAYRGHWTTWRVIDAYDAGLSRTTAALSVSAIDTGTEVITTSVTHGFLVDFEVLFAGTSPPGGITFGQTYFVVSVESTTSFKVSETRGGSPVNLTSAGTAVTVTGRGFWVDLINGYLTFVPAPTGAPRVDAYNFLSAFKAADVIAALLFDWATNTPTDDLSFSSHASAWTAEVGAYHAERVNLLDVLDELLADTLSLYSSTRDGAVFLASLLDATDIASATVRLAITEDALHAPPALERVLLPINGALHRTNRNANPVSAFVAAVDADTQFAFSQTHQSFAVVAGATSGTDNVSGHRLRVEKYEINGYALGTGTATAARHVSYRAKKIAQWRLVCSLAALDVRLGDVVTVRHPRFGLSSGVRAQVVAVQDRLDRDRVELSVLIPAYSSDQLT